METLEKRTYGSPLYQSSKKNSDGVSYTVMLKLGKESKDIKLVDGMYKAQDLSNEPVVEVIFDCATENILTSRGPWQINAPVYDVISRLEKNPEYITAADVVSNENGSRWLSRIIVGTTSC